MITDSPPFIFADLSVAGGRYEHDARGDGGATSGTTDGGFARLRGEGVGDSAMGLGLSFEGTRSDGDLFESRPVDTSGRTADVFFYSLYFLAGLPPADDEFRLPLRFGPYYHDVAIENDVSPTRVRWSGLGVRLEIEPEYWIVRRDDVCFGLVGGLSGGIHVSDVDLRGGGSRTTLNGSGYTLGAELGVQALFNRRFTTRLAWLYRDSIESRTDTQNQISVKGASASFSGLELSVGVRF